MAKVMIMVIVFIMVMVMVNSMSSSCTSAWETSPHSDPTTYCNRVELSDSRDPRDSSHSHDQGQGLCHGKGHDHGHSHATNKNYFLKEANQLNP